MWLIESAEKPATGDPKILIDNTETCMVHGSGISWANCVDLRRAAVTEPYLSLESFEARWGVRTAVKMHLTVCLLLVSYVAPNSLLQTRTGFSLTLEESLCLLKKKKEIIQAPILETEGG